jgi:DNA helicase-2/ATP-dependent DNA helicase PcrA
MTHEPTEEQQAIYDRLATGNGWVIVDALAGSGKTEVTLQALRRVPQKSVLVTAFNKRICEETKQRMPQQPKGSVWQSQTFHAAGFRVLNFSVKKQLEVSSAASEELVNDAATLLDGSIKVSFQVRRAVTRLLRLYKETFSGPEISYEQVKDFALNFDVFTELDDESIEIATHLLIRAYDLGLDIKSRSRIDFCDMIWLPVVLDLKPPSRYQAVFVDELQDLSPLQSELILKLIAPDGRFLGVGDLRQAIYSWRGADGVGIYKQLEARGAVRMPLNTTFRCSQAVVAEANRLMPNLRAWKNASAGRVDTMDVESAIEQISESYQDWSDAATMVLSYTNSELLRVAVRLFNEDVDFTMLGGEEIVAPLIELVKKFDKSSGPRFRANLQTWFVVEMARAEKQGSSGWADRIEQYRKSLDLILDAGVDPIRIVWMLNQLAFGEKNAPIVLSTVHKAKGLEADHVYLMRRSFPTYQENRIVTDEHRNLEYVAITRAKRNLTWIV